MQIQLDLKSNTSLEAARQCGFEDWVSTFDTSWDALPVHRLQPLSPADQIRHFERLVQWNQALAAPEQQALRALTAEMPNLYAVLPAILGHQAELTDYKVLYDWLHLHLKMLQIEQRCNLASITEQGEAESILQTLTEGLSQHGCEIKPTSQHQSALHKMLELQESLNTQKQEFDARLCEQYAFRKIPARGELETDHGKAIRMQSDGVAQILGQTPDFTRIQVQWPEAMQGLKSRIADLQAIVHEESEAQLRKLCHKLKRSLFSLQQHVQTRAERILRLGLLKASQNHHLCLPRVQFEPRSLAVQQFRHPKLQAPHPIDLDLQPGSNLILGPNFSGKTTALSSLAFMGLCIQYGLPVPANHLQSSPVESIRLILRNSGSLQNSESGFTQEIRALGAFVEPLDWVLADEFLQSTEPVTGTRLAQLILKDFARMDALFVASSHYPDLIHTPDIQLYEVEENYQLRAIYAHEACSRFATHRQKALDLALNLPIRQSLLNQIRKEREGD